MAGATGVLGQSAILLLALFVTPGSAFAEQKRPARRQYGFEKGLRDRGATTRNIDAVHRRAAERLGLSSAPKSESLAEQFTRKRPEGAFAVVRGDKMPFQRSKQRAEPNSFDLTDRSNPMYIRWVQNALNRALNIELTRDGIQGRQTTRAICDFQKTHGLKVTGVVDGVTERLLANQAKSPPPVSPTFGPGVGPFFFPLESTGGPPLRWSRNPSRDPDVLDDAIYLDVRTDGGTTSVFMWLVPLRNVPPQRLDLAWGDVVQLKTPDALGAVAASSGTVLSVGESLPDEWARALKDAGIRHVQVSDRSPKRINDDHVIAALALTAQYERGKTLIFDGLPRSSGKGFNGLIEQMQLLGLPLEHAEAWGRLDDQIRAVEAETNRQVEVATKAAILDALQRGSTDTLVLFAHSQDGSIRLPGGDSIRRDELRAISRTAAPPRTIVLISCDTGNINAETAAVAEILLENKLGITVLAPPGPVSAREVPRMLRRFLGEGATLDHAFNSSLRIRGLSRLSGQWHERGDEARE